ncbi:MAG: nucleotide exchange factor GrpE [Myxococcota bacterium]|jgi:molecular chaperone GrpE|nr:nucleotide exchange factor GrpE [Myxococcota bacterium]
MSDQELAQGSTEEQSPQGIVEGPQESGEQGVVGETGEVFAAEASKSGSGVTEELASPVSSEEAPQVEAPKQAEAPNVEVIDWKDRCLRAVAELDNFRKRSARELGETRRRERSVVMRSWLDVVDSTERALNAATQKEGPWYEGMLAILRQMEKVLSSLGVRRIETEGQRFDPMVHEAIAAVPMPQLESGMIAFTDRSGWRYEDGEVLRAARVVVAKNG